MDRFAYRSLGYGKNPHISSNLRAYLEVLSTKFRAVAAVIDPGATFSKISQSGKERDFLSVPDVAANVWKCSRGIDKASLVSLARSAKDFLEGKPPVEGDRIPGTRIVLTDIDANPYAAYDAHPDNRRDGVGVGWGSVPKSVWFETYSKAFEILRKADSGFFLEMDGFLRKIVPLWTDAAAHRSCSYAESFGCIYAWLVPNEPRPELSVLEALIHEWSHNKANLARNLSPLVRNGNEEAYYSAYRPDPRPIEGIFLGVHAFAPTVRVFLNAFESGAVEPSLRITKAYALHLKNRSALEVLGKYLDPAPEWAEFFGETEAVHNGNEERFRSYRERFAKEFERAEASSAEHRLESKKSYPNIFR